MKGIILAGGHGTRLHPMTLAVSKHLLPVYNKPMIYYPLSTLMLGGARDILVITKPEDRAQYERLLGDGGQFGIRIQYANQPEPDGIARAIDIGADFIGNDTVTLILGDNIFYGAGLGERLRRAGRNNTGATVFAHHVSQPQNYGVVTFDTAGKPLSIEEKPQTPKSNWALTGLYVYGPDAIEMVKKIKPSARGEREITDLNKLYLDEQRLNLEFLTRGFCWMDMGTPDNLLAAADYVRTIEERQGLKVCDPLEVAQFNGWC